ncbi:MAG TPA: translation initiation factor IF-2 [Candidatus Sulfotelmatobacter sp.]|nr:translation initiation factor IF-2 [Candidatus Sulfotelmatobacter sp.]
MDKKTVEKNLSDEFYPPVVAVLGHVDHGKTSLLDAIRKTDIATREHGGITQKIGASEIEIEHDKKLRKITFIDTPGHQAFFQMRGRGVQAADVGLLIVSLVDGVMPQTVESIKLLKDSKIPYIVVLTKSDDPKKLPDKAKQQLIKEDVLLEGYGGEIPFIEVSAKENQNIKELLDLILLIYEVKKHANFYPFTKNGPFMGIVIESKMNQKSGPRATIVVKNGILKLREEIYADNTKAKVRNLISDKGKNLQEASVGDAVEVLGFEKVPSIGSVVTSIQKEIENLSYIEEVSEKSFSPFDNEDTSHLSVVLCADSQGSLEAIKNAMPEGIKFIVEKTGDIEVSDVLFAKSSKAVVLGFNVKIKPEIAKLARTEKVLVKNYTIIYEMLDEISDLVQGKIEALQEEILGISKILAKFPFDKTYVCGVKVSEGRLAKGDKVRLLRQDEVVGESHINSVRKGKEQASKIEAGEEGGIVLSPYLDFTIGDMLISHN